ncbi:MAG TPA: ATP-binding cassette domain-containing protein [Sphingomonadales bacterium]|nr:ATP-binding cassette domain-containing protein [Sphingomonadales bacterium]
MAAARVLNTGRARSLAQSTDEGNRAAAKLDGLCKGVRMWAATFQESAVIRFHEVGMSYGGGEEVLSGLTFALESGSFHFLTGPSGAGKSSLLKLLHLAHLPSHGAIEFLGTKVRDASRRALTDLRRRIGFVFQDFRLLDHLSALENVMLPLVLRRGEAAEARANAVEMLEWVGLGDKINASPPTLSGGEKQRVAIARAVIVKPDLLLADEPTGNVDPDMAKRLLGLFIELNKLGTTTVIATHDPAVLASMAAPALRLNKGRLVQE